MRIDELSDVLRKGDDDIYRAGGIAAVSYADDGHAGCFGVEDRSFWFRHRNACISTLVARHPFGSGPFLDIGGGNGYVAKRLQDDGHTVVLLEPGPVGAGNARHGRGLRHVVCGTLEHCRFHPGSFAAVGMFDVIEHIDDDRGFIQDVARLLPRGGHLYLSVPCHTWLWSQADIVAGHFRRHTRASMADLLAPHFRADFSTYIFAPLVIPQLLLRALPYRLGLSRRELLSQSAEHGEGQGFLVKAIEALLARELDAIRAGRALPFGASAIVVASRV